MTWPLVPLEKVLRLVSRPEPVDPERTYRMLGAHWYAQGLYIKDVKQGSEIRAKHVFRVEEGDFVYNRLFAWKGSFAVATAQNHGCYVSNEFPCFEVNQNLIDPQYLWRYFSRAESWAEALGLSSGGTPTSRNRLKEDQFLAMKIPLPPLEEQRRILARIEELAAKIEEARGMRQQAIEEAESLVKVHARNLLSSIQSDVTELRCWLDPNRAGIQTGPFGAQLGSHEFRDAGIPVLTIGNIQYAGLDLRELKYVSHDKAQQLNRYVVHRGDILFARMGTVGRCCVVPEEAEGWLINYHIIRAALDTSRIEPRYVHWSIRVSADVEQYLSHNIRGATRKGVNSKIVGSLPCRVPPISEQRRIIADLDDLQRRIDALRQLQTQTAAELDALLPSILDKAFKGEL